MSATIAQAQVTSTPKIIITPTTFQSLDKKAQIKFADPVTTAAIETIASSTVSTMKGWRLISEVYSFNSIATTTAEIKLSHNTFSGADKQLFSLVNDKWQLVPGQKNINNQIVAKTSPNQVYAVWQKIPQKLVDLEKVITAKSAIVADSATGKIIWQKNGGARMPIASLTKLMTALVFLDSKPDWQKAVEIKPEDKTIPIVLNLKDGDKATIDNLFKVMLTRSANNVARAIARISGLTEKNFVKQMNLKAKKLGLTQTKFVEPTGLDEKNVSSARDYLKLVKVAYANSKIAASGALAEYEFNTIGSGEKILVKNTSTLFTSDLQITGAKTGYTEEAGRCQMIKVKNDKKELVVIVLNSKIGRHTTDAYDLAKYFLGK